MTKRKQFTCDQCGGHTVEQLMGNVEVISILEVNKGIVQYGPRDLWDGDVTGYRCADCEMELDIHDINDLVELLGAKDYEIKGA
jgi:hypothetical protein